MIELTEEALATYNAELEHKSPSEKILWGAKHFGKALTILCGFGRGSSVLIHETVRLGLDVRFVFVDPLVLDEASYEFVRMREQRYRITIEPLRPTEEDLALLPGEPSVALFKGNETVRKQCCEYRKNRPLKRGMFGHPALISSLRPDSTTKDRISVSTLEIDARHGGYLKINACCECSSEYIDRFIQDHKVPIHPFYGQGYGSIGCRYPCTIPAPGRKGRWFWLKNRFQACCDLCETSEQP